MKNYNFLTKKIFVFASVFLVLSVTFLLFRHFSTSRLINRYTFQYTTENPAVIPLGANQYNEVLDRLETDPNYLYIRLGTTENTKLTGFAFLFFNPRIKDDLRLMAFQNYFVPEKTNLNINFFEEKINGSHGIVDTHEEQTVKNLKVYFDSYENQVLTGRIEFDIFALRFSFPKKNRSAGCIDPGFTPGGYDMCFDKVFAPTDKKVVMPFEIKTY